jgi:nucleoside-diphosphate-sugar epimerase
MFTADDPVSTSTQPYTQSKAESERYARALQAAARPVVSVYPSAVNGPTDVGVNVNAAAYGMLLAMPFIMVPEAGGMLLVDVRDLATGTVALLTPGCGPRRYVVGGHFLEWPLVASLIDRITGYRRDHQVMGPEQMRQFLDEELVEIMLRTVPADDAPFLRDSGITWRPVEATLTDTLRWTVERGVLGAEWAPALAPNAVQ